MSTENEVLAERRALRIGAVSAIASLIILLIASIPLTPPLLHISDITDTEAVLQEITVSGGWIAGYLGILVSIFLVVIFLVALYSSIRNGWGAALARLGFAAALISGAVAVIRVAVEGLGMKLVAEGWAGTAVDKVVTLGIADVLWHVNLAIIALFAIVFYGVTFILYGLAVLLSSTYPKWLGWVAVAIGVVMAILGFSIALMLVALEANSEAITLMILYLYSPLVYLIFVWVFVIGILMWRKAG